MTIDVVTAHRDQAWDFLDKSRQYLDEGDLHQASEKAWGAAAQMIKAVAAARGWEYERHEQFFTVIDNARSYYRQPQLRQLGNAAHALHSNFYKRKEVLNAHTIADDIGDVQSLLEILTPLIE